MNQKVFQDSNGSWLDALQGNEKSVKEIKANIIIFSKVVHLLSSLIIFQISGEGMS